jgi:hypothetical protein
MLLAASLCGCSSVIDHIPTSLGGLPEGVPPRKTTQGPYPSVHDMPPARQDSVLSESESKRLREDLKLTRSRVATPPAETPAAPPNP